MNEQEVTQFVITELGKQRNRSDIIMKLCAMTGGSWQQSEGFVEQVEQQHRKSISARQTPLFLAIGAGTFLAGMYILISITVSTVNGAIYYLPYVPLPYSGNLARFAVGLAMVLGASYGIFRALWSLVK